MALLASVLLTVVSAAGPGPAAASSADEQAFIHLVNNLRAGRGLAPLTSHGELRAGARSWTDHMAKTGQLAHSPNMSAGLTAAWSVLGENVGMHGAQDVNALFQAFVNSPAHYQNLVDDRFNYIGVGVTVSADGMMWTTHRFMAAQAPAPTTTQPPPPPPPPPTVPDTAPSTMAPTTPVPPTTIPPPTTVPSTVGPATTPATTPPTPVPITAPPPTTPTTPSTASTTAVPDGAEPMPVVVDPTEVDDPTAGPSEPDTPMVEQVLVELAEAGI